MSLPPHEYIKHDGAALLPLDDSLLVDLLDPCNHLFDGQLAESLQALVRLVANTLVFLLIIADQLDKDHDPASLQQALLVLKTVIEHVGQAQARCLLRVEACALQLIQQDLDTAHLTK